MSEAANSPPYGNAGVVFNPVNHLNNGPSRPGAVSLWIAAGNVFYL